MLQSLIKSIRDRVVVIGCALLIGLGVVIFLVARSEKNAPAIQAVTSYVLVIVTIAYVVFTHRLVQAQRKQARIQLETQALVELARKLHTAKRFLIPVLEDLFPLPGRGPKPNFEHLARPDKHLLDLYWDLNGLAPDLPREIREQADETWRAVWMASSDTINILWAFHKEEEAAETESRPWSWDGAARFYREVHEVGKKREPGYWYEMIRGERVREAISALTALDAEVERLRS